VKFVVAVPRLSLCEEFEAETPEQACSRLRDSDVFDKGMTDLLGAGSFEDLFLDNPPQAFVIDTELFTVTVWELEIGWRRRGEPEQVPF
jgi:hypothetical protein